MFKRVKHAAGAGEGRLGGQPVATCEPTYTMATTCIGTGNGTGCSQGVATGVGDGGL